MGRQNITAENTEFIILCFEGPDRYSLAGGLGVRVTNLSLALGKMGFKTHLIYVGDPRLSGEEVTNAGRLTLHRWCQWISEYYPEGVYQGENEKLYDFNRSVPGFVMERIVKPAVAEDKLVVILGEEWHTAEVMCRISNLLCYDGLRDRVLMFWNANNTFSFDRIDWGRLAGTTTITTVSRYMKHIMRGMGLNPLVIPNGIPSSLLSKVNLKAAVRLRTSVDADVVLSKVARFDPDKRWNMAVEATARLKANGRKAVLLARGGIEPYGGEVMRNARSLGLSVEEVRATGDTFKDYLEAIVRAGNADVVNLSFHLPQEFLRILYCGSDAVLANSGHEPFGLVGLEVMAAGGIAFVGGTGEDYAMPFRNCFVLETPDAKEIELYLMYLKEHPDEEDRIRRAARKTAMQFTWEHVIQTLIKRLEHQARGHGLLVAPDEAPMPELMPFELEREDELVPA